MAVGEFADHFGLVGLDSKDKFGAAFGCTLFDYGAGRLVGGAYHHNAAFGGHGSESREEVVETGKFTAGERLIVHGRYLLIYG